MRLAVEVNLVDQHGRWTGNDVRESVRRHGAEDVAHVLRWAVRGWWPFRIEDDQFRSRSVHARSSCGGWRDARSEAHGGRSSRCRSQTARIMHRTKRPFRIREAQPSNETIVPEQGVPVLDDILAFVSRFIIYPSEHARTAHVLWIAHAHLMGVWDSTPRIAFLSPEPASGKSRAIEVSELLVPAPVEAVNVSPAYLFRKIGGPEEAADDPL